MKQQKRRKSAKYFPPSNKTILPISKKFSAPNSEGQNFIQNIPLPNKLVIQAKTERSGGTSIKPNAGCVPSARYRNSSRCGS
jgi:hypothetical protein